MALQIKSVSIIGAGIGASLGTTDSIVVGPGVLVASSGTIGISGDGSGHHASIYGSVMGATVGIFLGNDFAADSGQRLYVGAGADVAGGTSGAKIVGQDSRVINYGSIHGEKSGLVLSGQGFGFSTLNNQGEIDSTGSAVTRQGSADTETLIITNFGRIAGDAFSYNANGTNAIDKIFNHGLMIGNINLGSGNDLYDGRDGKAVGVISGGAGNDFFLLGANPETVNGGSGTDVLDCRYGAGVTIALDGSVHNAGAATGDVYSAIESVVGSLLKNDSLTGNASANELVGLGGRDFLSGNAGSDSLSGGVGADRVIGGAGNDYFDFFSLNEVGDLILDYSNVSGNNDTIRISAFDFGGGLSLGALAATRFQSRADNHAQDNTDRFIFRTTDKTLWFDVDGTGAEGPVMIADLQATATISAADIVLI